jgi:predicted Zn-dependent protease
LKAVIAKTRKVLEDGIKRWPADGRFQRPLAQVLLAQGDFLGGEKVLKEHAARPEVTDKLAAEVQLAEYYTLANKPAMAEETLRQAMARPGGDVPPLRQELAQLLARTNRPEEAVKLLEGLTGPAIVRQRVQLLLAANKVAEAQKVVAEAVAANPGALELSNLQIDLLLGSGQFAEAERLVQQRLAKGDADGDARYYSAMIKLRRQPGADPAAAVRELTALASDYPRNVRVLALLAEAHHATNDLDAAIDDLNRALVIEPLNRDVRLKLIQWAAGAARWDVVNRLATEALAQPRLASDPSWPRAMAGAAAAAGKFAEAEKHIAKAISMVPPERAAELQHDQLSILNQGKGYAKVLKTSDAMLAEGREDWWIHQFRGVAKAALKDAPGAAKEFDAALAGLDAQKQFGAAATVVRTMAASSGKDAAMKRVEQLAPTNPRWPLVAAEICLDAKDAAGALAHLQPLEADADKLPPDARANLYRTLADSYHTLNPARTSPRRSTRTRSTSTSPRPTCWRSTTWRTSWPRRPRRPGRRTPRRSAGARTRSPPSGPRASRRGGCSTPTGGCSS